jgi:Tfp pilus assembly protein PilX
MATSERGSAMVVVLVLMTVLGSLALAAAAAAMTALALAGHQHMAQNAFEAAETAILAALLAATETRAAGTQSGEILPELPTARADYLADTREAPGAGALPAGFSVGENTGSFATRQFFITADGASGRGARQRLEQGFYFVVPVS